MGKRFFTNSTSDRGLISKIYKELKKLMTKNTNNPIKKWGIDLNQDFTTEESQMAEKHQKKCSKSLMISERQIKRTLRFTLHQSEWLGSKPQVREDVEKEEHSSISGGIANWYNHFGNQSGVSSEN